MKTRAQSQKQLAKQQPDTNTSLLGNSPSQIEYHQRHKENIEKIYLPKINLRNHNSQNHSKFYQVTTAASINNSYIGNSPQSCPVRNQSKFNKKKDYLEVNSLTSLDFKKSIKYEQPFFKRKSKTSQKLRIVYKKVDKSADTTRDVLASKILVKAERERMQQAANLYGTPCHNKNKFKQEQFNDYLTSRLNKPFDHLEYNKRGRYLVNLKENIAKNKSEQDKYVSGQLKFIRNTDRILETRKYSSQRTVEVSKVNLKQISKGDMAVINSAKSKAHTQM